MRANITLTAVRGTGLTSRQRKTDKSSAVFISCYVVVTCIVFSGSYCVGMNVAATGTRKKIKPDHRKKLENTVMDEWKSRRKVEVCIAWKQRSAPCATGLQWAWVQTGQ